MVQASVLPGEHLQGPLQSCAVLPPPLGLEVNSGHVAAACRLPFCFICSLISVYSEGIDVFAVSIY